MFIISSRCISFLALPQEVSVSPIRIVFSLPPTLLLLSSFLILGGCSAPEGNIADGKRWYRMHTCHACHGQNGNDGRAPKIAGLDMSYRSFLSRLRETETAIMPRYPKEKINDQDAADILVYLKSLD